MKKKIYTGLLVFFLESRSFYNKIIHQLSGEGWHPASNPDRILFVIFYNQNPYAVELIPVTSVHYNDMVDKIRNKEWLPFTTEHEEAFLKKFKYGIPGLKDGAMILYTDPDNFGSMLYKKHGKLTQRKSNYHDVIYDINLKRQLKSFGNEIYFARLKYLKNS